MSLSEIEITITLVATLAMFVAKAFAFFDAVTRRPDVFVAANKLTKQAWLIILGLAVVAHWMPLGLINIAGLIAAIVYIVDVRPAIRGLRRSY